MIPIQLRVRSRATDVLILATVALLIATAVPTLPVVPWPVAVGTVAGELLLVAVLVVFSRLDVTVDEHGTEASWRGWFPKRVAHADLTAVEVAPYRLGEFFGWGLRASFGGARAYSLLGVPGTVRLSTDDGHTFVITVPEPEQLAAAIRERAPRLRGQGATS
jgi:hypothetical protein